MALIEDVKRIDTLRREQRRLQKRIDDLTRQIEKSEALALKRSRIVSDSVTCGRKGRKPLRTVKIMGVQYDYAARHRAVQRGLLVTYQERLLEIDQRILAVERQLQSVNDPVLRLIVSARIDGSTWQQIAAIAGGTEGSCRKTYERWLLTL